MKGVHVGMKVEVVNCSMDVVDDTDVAFWVATVIEIKHYRVKLRYEGYEVNPAGDFWFDLRSKNIHPVGWCAKRNKLLIPPPGMITLHPNIGMHIIHTVLYTFHKVLAKRM